MGSSIPLRCGLGSRETGPGPGLGTGPTDALGGRSTAFRDRFRLPGVLIDQITTEVAEALPILNKATKY
jgi:hypothetical protein